MSSSCISASVSHAAKGTAYFFGASGSLLALIMVATTVVSIALGLLAWDGSFLYYVGIKAPLHLFWVIPVTLAFIAIDALVILAIGRLAHRLSVYLAETLCHHGKSMCYHFRQIQCYSR